MSRELIGYFNESYGKGLEGLANYSNTIMNYWLVPLFLAVFYGLSIYISSKSEWKLGASIMWISLVFFILGMIAQTFTQFNQIIIFAFAVGILVGLVISYMENAK